MKAIVQKRYGSSDDLQLREADGPKSTTTVVEAQLIEESKLKAAGVTTYVGMGSRAMMMPGEKRGGFQRSVHPLLSLLTLFGVDMLEQNEWESDSLLMGKNGAQRITWMLTRPARPTRTPFVGGYAHKDRRGSMNCSIYDHGDSCLYCVASSERDKLAPHVSSAPQLTRDVGRHNQHHQRTTSDTKG